MLRSQDDSPAFRKLAMERTPLFIPRPLGVHTPKGRGFMPHGGASNGSTASAGLPAAYAGSSPSAALSRQEQLLSAGLISLESDMELVRSWVEGARQVEGGKWGVRGRGEGAAAGEVGAAAESAADLSCAV